MSDLFKIPVGEPVDETRLIRFTGVLKQWSRDVREFEGRPPSMGVKFDFIDITVLESTEPYNFPIFSQRIPLSERAHTAWAAFTASLRNLVPMEVLLAAPEALDVLVGKKQEWYYAPVKLRRPGREGEIDEKEWKLRDAKAWTIVDLEGYGGAAGANILDAIVEFLGEKGKKDSEIYQWLYTDQSLKSMSGFAAAIEAVSERNLLTGLVAAGKIKESGELWIAVN